MADPGMTEITAAVAAHAAGRQALENNLIARIRRRLMAFGRWYDDLAVRRLSKEIRSEIAPVQAVMTAQENAYLSTVTSLLRGKPSALPRLVSIDDLRAGIDPETVYERLGEQYRYARSTGKTDQQALDSVLNRADVMAQTDVALAARRQDAAFFERNKIKGYRRVVHPELSKGGSCGLCIVASDRIYYKDRLMPIHARCHCGVMPIIGSFDAGHSLNQLDLGSFYEAAGSTRAADLKRTKYRIAHHGELGPILVEQGAPPPLKKTA